MEEHKNKDTFTLTLLDKSGAFGSFGVAMFTMPILLIFSLYDSYIWNHQDSPENGPFGIDGAYITVIEIANPLWMIPVLGCYIGYLAKLHSHGMEKIFRFVAIINYTLSVIVAWLLGLFDIEAINMMRAAFYYNAGLIALLVAYSFRNINHINESSITLVPGIYTPFIKNRWVAITLSLLFGNFIVLLVVAIIRLNTH